MNNNSTAASPRYAHITKTICTPRVSKNTSGSATSLISKVCGGRRCARHLLHPNQERVNASTQADNTSAEALPRISDPE